jgi:type I restriction enzyme S subunit
LKNDVDRLQSFASGSTFQELSGGVLRRMIFALPPLLEQQKIAEILGALDDKIELNRKMNKTLEQIAKTIYQKMFLNVNQGSLVGLGEKITIRKGKNITKDTVQAGNVPVVAGGLNPSCYHDTANTTAPVVTVSASGANAGFIRLYQDDVWASDCSYIDKTVTPYVYFYYLFLLENTENVSGLQRGSAQPHVYPKDLMELKMFNFDEKLIQKFEEIVIPIFEFISNNTKQVETLSQIRDFLLPRVMSGKLRVR